MVEGKRKKGKSDQIDIYVGARLKARRVLLGLSQKKLADFTGVSFQQIQKYEKGMNRISAGRLYVFAKLLQVETQFFYQGLDDKISTSSIEIAENIIDADYLNNIEFQRLARTFFSIEGQDMREEVQKFG